MVCFHTSGHCSGTQCCCVLGMKAGHCCRMLHESRFLFYIKWVNTLCNSINGVWGEFVMEGGRLGGGGKGVQQEEILNS